MADMTKQRLIGALLVLTVILISAVLLIQSANDNMSDSEQIELPEFQSSVVSDEPEVIEEELEPLVDPHQLEEEAIAAIEDKTVVAAITSEQESEVSKELSTEKIKDTANQQLVEPVKQKADEIKATITDKVKTTLPQSNKSAEPQWLIQVASFGLEDNANALQKKLTKLNINSLIEGKQNSQGKMIYRVKIGPNANRQQIDDTVAKIKQHLKLTPQIKLVEPTS